MVDSYPHDKGELAHDFPLFHQAQSLIERDVFLCGIEADAKFLRERGDAPGADDRNLLWFVWQDRLFVRSALHKLCEEDLAKSWRWKEMLDDLEGRAIDACERTRGADGFALSLTRWCLYSASHAALPSAATGTTGAEGVRKRETTRRWTLVP